MDDDIYKTPKSNLEPLLENSNELASRSRRLLASFLDSLTVMLITIPLMYFTGGIDVIQSGAETTWQYNIALALAGLLSFGLINARLLTSNGQTIGKKLLGIKIVDLYGNLPGVKSHLLSRYATYFLPGQVPVIGQIFSIINILFIFGSQKRCIHDRVAGTRVVRC